MGFNGEERSPRRPKTWALVAYLVLREFPPTRRDLAELFHPEANDPLGSLRWTIADARRLLRDGAALGGDPVVLELSADTSVDLIDLEEERDISEVVLLDGIELADARHLQAWLDLERYRLRARVVSLTKERAIAALAAGDAAQSVSLAERLVELEPRDEGHHALLVRGLVAAGDPDMANQRTDIGSRLLRDDFGVKEALLIDAARGGGLGVSAPSSPHAVQTLVDAGRSAMGAGFPDAALWTLADALHQARAGGDKEALMDALLAMAETLIHSVRGLDDMALELLAEAEAVAAVRGDLPRLAAARREFGYVALLAADYDASDRWLDKAAAASPDHAELGRIQSYRGLTLHDRGRIEEAIPVLTEAAEFAAAAGDDEQRAFALGMLGRAYLASNDLDQARRTLEESIDAVKTSGWTSFLPFSEAMLAEVLLRMGRTDEAIETAEQGFVLACEIGDPCWEGMNERALGLAALEKGDRETAYARLEDAYHRATRVPDTWWWVVAYILAPLSDVLVDIDPQKASRRAEELETIAAAAGMSDLVERAASVKAALSAT